MKYPLTPAGIEPATFRCVAQHLKHCATAVRLEIVMFCNCHFENCMKYTVNHEAALISDKV